MHIHFNNVDGFTYQGGNYCKPCTRLLLGIGCVQQEYLTVTDALDSTVHELVGVWAARNNIPAYVPDAFSVYDTEKFDSDALPKPFEDGDGEECHGCGLVIA